MRGVIFFPPFMKEEENTILRRVVLLSAVVTMSSKEQGLAAEQCAWTIRYRCVRKREDRELEGSVIFVDVVPASLMARPQELLS